MAKVEELWFIADDVPGAKKLQERLEHAGLVCPYRAGNERRRMLAVMDIERVLAGRELRPGDRLFISDGARLAIERRTWLANRIQGGGAFLVRQDALEPLDPCSLQPTGERHPFSAVNPGPSVVEASTMAAMDPGKENIDFRRGTVAMWRWEKWDFENQQAHMSCPVCFSLTRAPIDDAFSGRSIRCPQSDCTFAGLLAYDPVARKEFDEQKASASAGSCGRVGFAFPGVNALMSRPTAEDCKKRGMYGNYRQSSGPSETDPAAARKAALEQIEKRLAIEGIEGNQAYHLDSIMALMNRAGVVPITVEYFDKLRTVHVPYQTRLSIDEATDVDPHVLRQAMRLLEPPERPVTFVIRAERK